jgi:type II secretory pathway component PulF
VRYSAEYVDREGVPRTENVEARDRAEALSSLGEKRWALARLAPEGAVETVVTTEVTIARQLARLVRLGVPLGPALRSLASADPALDEAARRTEEGAPLSRATAAAGGALSSPVLGGLLEAGESAQTLEHALDEVAALASRIALARDHLRAALAYPTVLAVFGLLLSVVYVVIAGPAARALVLCQEVSARPTPALLAATAWAGERLLLVAAGAVLALALVALVRRALLRGQVPVLGRALRGRLQTAFALRALSALVARGVPLPRAWAIATSTLDLGTRDPGARAQDGADVARLVRASGLASPVEALGLEAAARAGQDELARALDEAARDREAALERAVARLTLAVEPFFDLVFGALVLLAALSWVPFGTGGLG